jgi:hypothetical protein
LRPLVAAAALNAALHIAGLTLALFAMRPGSAVVAWHERLSYLAARPLGWVAGWGTWMLCAAAFVVFVAALRPYADAPRLAAAAMATALAGAAIDLLCDTGQIVVLPALAADPTRSATFAAWERGLGAGGTIAANGLYSVALLLVALSVRRRASSAAWILALVTFVFGLALAAAGLVDDARLVELVIGPMFVAFLSWTAA